MVTSEQIEQERPYLFRYALAQLRERDAADEVVQETLLAALESRASFSGRSTLRTWLTSILRFKLIDALRSKTRNKMFVELDEDLDEGDCDGLFSADGHWSEAVRAWNHPERALLGQQFWDIFESCAAIMPRRTAMVFVMREVMGMEIADICNNLEISATNCSVLLYRARMSLRECFTIRWGREATL